MMKMIKNLIRREGGYSENLNDSAHQLRTINGDRWDSSVTKYGITQSTLSDYLGRQATKSEIRSLTKARAYEIYLKVYLVSPKINHLHQSLQEVVFDMAVHAGVNRAILLLQRLLSDGGFPVAEDGIIGVETISATENAMRKFEGYFVNAYVEERVKYYHKLIDSDKSQSSFRVGWMRRATDFLISGQGDDVVRGLAGENT